jgi:hypothetical protein
VSNTAVTLTGGKLVRHSFRLGSVRLLETMPCSDPPTPAELAACRQWLKDFLRKEVRPKLIEEMGGGVDGGALWLHACGSTRIGASIVHRHNPERAHFSPVALNLLSSAVVEGLDDAAKINRHELVVGSAGELIQLMLHAIEDRPFHAGKHAG